MARCPTAACIAAWIAPLALAAGAAAQAPGSYPLDVAAAPSGDLIVADRNLPGVWKQPAEGPPQVVFRAAAKFGSPLNAIRCVAVDSQGRILAGDTAAHDVYRLDEQGVPRALTGGKVRLPMDLAVGAEEGELWIADAGLHCVWKLAGGRLAKFADVRAPVGVHAAASGELLVVSRRQPHLLRVGAAGEASPVLPAPDPFQFPHSVTAREGALYVVDGYAKAVWRVAQGKADKWAEGPPLDNPAGSTWLGDRLIVADPRAARLLEVDAEEIKSVAKLPE